MTTPSIRDRHSGWTTRAVRPTPLQASRRQATRRLFTLGLTVLLIYASIEPARGWNPHGHQVVAFIAYQHLTPAAKTRVLALLKLNPMFKTWIKGLPANASAERKTRRAFVEAATWPDVIKGLPNYVNDGPEGGNFPPDSPTASQNIGYPDLNRHKYWHFVDVPFSDDGTPVRELPVPNALTQIELFIGALASPSTSDDIKSYDLVWLIHLVGDVHQPLHAAERFRKNNVDGDSGGNEVKLRCAGPVACASNLHSMWDGALGSSPDLATITAEGNALDARPVDPDPEAANPKAWIQQSSDLARSDVYKTTAGVALGNPVADIDAAYATRSRSIAETRAIIGARRLAALINAAFDPTETARRIDPHRCGLATAGGSACNTLSAWAALQTRFASRSQFSCVRPHLRSQLRKGWVGEFERR
jgi:hypothetical protein